jgi:CubicO group peptidase (beta-lactamase class C family)
MRTPGTRSLALAAALVLSLASLVLAELPVVGPTPAPELVPIDDVMKNILGTYAIPGAVVGIVRDGELVFIRGYGYSDPARQTVVELDSQFRIASISKPITAMAILKLVEQGLLSLDDKAFQILPPAVPVADQRVYDITIRNLLEHKGGWDRDGTGYDPMFRDNEVAQSVGKPLPIQCPDIIQHMMGRRLDFDPGAKSAYSNFGYCVLGEVIESRSRVRYDEYIRDNILTPLGMTRTQLGSSSDRGRAEYEVTYADYPGAPLVPSVLDGLGLDVPFPYGGFSQEAMKANGGWISTASDMLRFVAAATGARYPSPLTTPPSGFPGYVPPRDPGFTWEFRGSLPGTSAVVWVVNLTSGSKVSFIVLMNSRPAEGSGPLLDRVTKDIREVLKNVTQWPTVDLFRSRFDPSRASVEIRYDGSPGSSITQIPVSVQGDPVPIDIQIAATGQWLAARPSSSTAPTLLDVSLEPGTWRVGNYTGSITVSSPHAENQLQVLVKLAVLPYEAGGRVMHGTRPIGGVLVTFTAVSGRGTVPPPVQTDRNGAWKQTGFEWGTTYAATPSKKAAKFVPQERRFSLPHSGLDFETGGDGDDEGGDGDDKDGGGDEKGGSGLRIGKDPVTKDSDVYKDFKETLGSDAVQVLDHMIADKHKPAPWGFFKNVDELRRFVTFRVRLLEAAREFASMQHGFVKGAKAAAGIQSWKNFEVTTGRGTFPRLYVNLGRATPSAAVEAIFDPRNKGNTSTNPPSYFFWFDCANAQTVAFYRAALTFLRAAEFNRRMAAGLEISFRIWEGKYDEDKKSDLIPGDGFSFDNPDAVNKSAKNENAMYLGKNDKGERMFFAHDFGVKSEKELLALLDALPKEGKMRKAEPREHYYHRWPVP